MPDMNGYDLAVEARKLTPDIQVIFTSGFSIDQLRASVTDPFLPKPFTAEALTNVVQDSLISRL